ncbi:MAG: peptidylprolyl isomerase [Gammaproteobacteria bacterium]|nr:peptidylprolyl isomerase [Gammaproteobacteria bacterium]
MLLHTDRVASSFFITRMLTLLLLYVTAIFNPIFAADVTPLKAGVNVDQKPPLNYLAKVGAETILLADYYEQLQKGMKEKFFHGKIPDKELKKFRRDLATQMVNKVLYVQEAKRRRIVPDKSDVEIHIKNLERKKKKDVYWQEHKDQLLKQARLEYELDSLVKQLESKVRSVDEPRSPEIQNYYKSNEDKFTAPERVKVHMIMLKVDPSAGGPAWDEAAKTAGEISSKIRQGQSFEELARIHSGDDTAASGGDMGYIHKGMMGGNAAEVLDKMKIGDVSEPVFLLEGVAIFRLDDREVARVNELPRVEAPAKDLLRKEMAEKAWKDLTERLRKSTEIILNESVL